MFKTLKFSVIICYICNNKSAKYNKLKRKPLITLTRVSHINFVAWGFNEKTIRHKFIIGIKFKIEIVVKLALFFMFCKYSEAWFTLAYFNFSLRGRKIIPLIFCFIPLWKRRKRTSGLMNREWFAVARKIIEFFCSSFQLENMDSNSGPVLIDLIRSSLPSGVRLSIHRHTDECESAKFIPDLELLDLKEQLEDLRGGRVRKKKK